MAKHKDTKLAAMRQPAKVSEIILDKHPDHGQQSFLREDLLFRRLATVGGIELHDKFNFIQGC